MNDIIHLLPDSVANQIAAGEVIQRPAAVIKELVENSIDAGATEIEIFIKDGGRTLIQVIDNGRGMSETDARMAFERHATSKIRKAEDLFSLRSMGFRGEALPSICAIARVEVRTRPKDAQMGTRLIIEGTKVESQEPDVCEAGTSIAVSNLFFNQPGRRRFLKSDNVELTNIMREFERLALVNNNVRMKINTGSKSIDLMAGSFRQRIGDIWKNNLSSQLVPVEIDTQLVRISGYVSRPEFARRRNALQYLIVNGRNMRHPYFHKAILSCFEPLIAPDTQPCYFIKFEVDPSSIDVNIHPTKNEIKFEFEQEIWKILSTSVKSALGMFSAVPSIDFDHDVVPIETLEPGEKPTQPELAIEKGYNPFELNDDGVNSWNKLDTSAADNFISAHTAKPESSHKSDSTLSDSFPDNNYPGNRHTCSRHQSDSSTGWESLYAGFMEAAKETANRARGNMNGRTSDVSASLPDCEDSLPGVTRTDTPSGDNPICMQIGLKYIITPVREGLMIIDQHRAHTQILFAKYMAMSQHGSRISQSVLFPEEIILDAGQRIALAGVKDDLASLGYIVEISGEDGEICRICGVPPKEPGMAEPKDVILRMLDSMIEDSANYGSDVTPRNSMVERTSLLMARASAIVKGRKLSSGEMENLVASLFQLPDPAFTPDGKKVYTILDNNTISNLLEI